MGIRRWVPPGAARPPAMRNAAEAFGGVTIVAFNECISARWIFLHPLQPGADALQVPGDVEILQRGFGPAHLRGLRAVLLDHALPGALAVQRAQLGKERARVEDGRGDHVTEERDDER